MSPLALIINEASVVKLSDDVFVRYEHNVGDGTLFLYNFIIDKGWVGNSSSNLLLKKLDGKKQLKDAYLELLPLFEGYEYSDLKASFDKLIRNLVEDKFLKVCE